MPFDRDEITKTNGMLYPSMVHMARSGDPSMLVGMLNGDLGLPGMKLVFFELARQIRAAESEDRRDVR